MIRSLLILAFLQILCPSYAQKVIQQLNPATGGIQLSKDIGIAKIDSGYTLWLPDKDNARGLVVFIHSRSETDSREEIIDLALENKLGVLYANTDNPVEFFFDVDRLQEIEQYIEQAISLGKIPRDNLLFCGMSLEGTRALKLALFSQSVAAQFKLKPRAIAICDAPLDMVRFHKAMTMAMKINFNAIAANEGNWVSGYLESNLGGTPESQLQRYIEYSPYSYLVDDDPRLAVFDGIAVRAYTEPDINWWIETRRKDYYSMNAIDLAALINQLKINGNQEAELIITHGKGLKTRRHQTPA